MTYELIPFPKPTKRPWGLLTDSMPELEVGDGKHWYNGIAIQPINGEMSRLSPEFCIGDSDDPYDAATVSTTDRFSAFHIVGTEKCSTLSTQYEWLQGRLKARYDVSVSEKIAEELEGGGHAPQIKDPDYGVLTDNPTLSNSAYPIGVTPDTVDNALALIEGGLAYFLHGAVGVIHMDPALFSLLSADRVELGADGLWRTNTGHIVLSDSGYSGIPPEGHDVEPGVKWIYGSGTIAYKLVPIDGIDNPSDNFDQGHNDYTGRVLALALYAFDTNTVIAAPVDLPPAFGVEGS
jgi:hypothetical protein